VAPAIKVPITRPSSSPETRSIELISMKHFNCSY
jgi:hypothetical protein